MGIRCSQCRALLVAPLVVFRCCVVACCALGHVAFSCCILQVGAVGPCPLVVCCMLSPAICVKLLRLAMLFWVNLGFCGWHDIFWCFDSNCVNFLFYILRLIPPWFPEMRSPNFPRVCRYQYWIFLDFWFISILLLANMGNWSWLCFPNRLACLQLSFSMGGN